MLGGQLWDGLHVVSLRRATVADGPQMAHVATEAYAPYVERMGGRRPAPMDTDYDQVVGSAEAWVAEEEGDVVGFLVLVGQDDGMLLENVAVLPSHQGRGVGRALLSLAEEQARAERHERILLYTNTAMLENQELYERIGYVEIRRAEEHGFARVFYEKALPR